LDRNKLIKKKYCKIKSKLNLVLTSNSVNNIQDESIDVQEYKIKAMR